MERAALNSLLSSRVQARGSKDWETSDRLRAELREAGYTINDAAGTWSHAATQASGTLVGADFFAAPGAPPSGSEEPASAVEPTAEATTVAKAAVEVIGDLKASVKRKAARAGDAYKPKRRDKKAMKREAKRQRAVEARMALVAAQLGLVDETGAAASSGAVDAAADAFTPAADISATDAPTLALRARLQTSSAVEAVNDAFGAPADWSLGGDGERCAGWTPRHSGSSRAQWPWHRACAACGQPADRHHLRCGAAHEASASVAADDDSELALALTTVESPEAALQLLLRLVRCARICGCSTALAAPVWTLDAIDAAATRVAQLRIERSGAARFSWLDSLALTSLLATARALAADALAPRILAAKGHAARARVELACALDSLYFEFHYAALVDARDAQRAPCVAAPAEYLAALLAWSPEAAARSEQLLRAAGESARSAARAPIRAHLAEAAAAAKAGKAAGKAAAAAEGTALLRVYANRWAESAVLLHAAGLANAAEGDGVGAQLAAKAERAAAAAGEGEGDAPPRKKSKKQKKKQRKSAKKAAALKSAPAATPCWPLLQKWRDNCRLWCCRLYAFATPTAAALAALAQCAPIIEVGAGTGYWAAALRAAHAAVEIKAWDALPARCRRAAAAAAGPGADRAQAAAEADAVPSAPVLANEYHGDVPTFLPVSFGGADELRGALAGARLTKQKTPSLFLCFPPPGETMALDSLIKVRTSFLLFALLFYSFVCSYSFVCLLALLRLAREVPRRRRPARRARRGVAGHHWNVRVRAPALREL